MPQQSPFPRAEFLIIRLEFYRAVTDLIALLHGKVGHTDYVTALTFIAQGASSWYPEGTIVSGTNTWHWAMGANMWWQST